MRKGDSLRFLPATLFAIAPLFKFSRGKNSWVRRRRRRLRRHCRNLRKKLRVQKPRRWRRRSRLAAASAHCQISAAAAASQALSLARQHAPRSSRTNGASSADSRIAKFASRHGRDGGGVGQREREDRASERERGRERGGVKNGGERHFEKGHCAAALSPPPIHSSDLASERDGRAAFPLFFYRRGGCFKNTFGFLFKWRQNPSLFSPLLLVQFATFRA